MKTELLPPNVRKPAYSIYALLGVVIGATQVGYSAAEAGQPTWLTVTLAVYAFVGGALGLTAAKNTDTTTATQLPGDWTGADSDEVIPIEDDNSDILDDAEPEGEADNEEPMTDEGSAEPDADADSEGPADDEDLEALAATEVDDTPPPANYQPRH